MVKMHQNYYQKSHQKDTKKVIKNDTNTHQKTPLYITPSIRTHPITYRSWTILLINQCIIQLFLRKHHLTRLQPHRHRKVRRKIHSKGKVARTRCRCSRELDTAANCQSGERVFIVANQRGVLAVPACSCMSMMTGAHSPSQGL